MTKRLTFATIVALAVSGGSALAADLPSYKAPLPPPPPPPPLWTGFYAGLNAGYGFGTTNQVNTASFPVQDTLAALTAPLSPFLVSNFRFGSSSLANTGTANVNQNGFIGGGQIGYNWQFYNSFVAGVEADIQGAGIRGRGGYSGVGADSLNFANLVTVNRTAIGSGDIQAGIDWMGTVRGRLGWLALPTLMVYGTGGLAYGGVYANATHSAAGTASLSVLGFPIASLGAPVVPGTARYSDTRVGWTAGGGFEWMLMPGWSVKAEALYYDLGSATMASSPVIYMSPISIPFLGIGGPLAANVPTSRIKYDGVIARAGVNYHFNWGSAPIVAKY
ncbi:porin family protein [Methylocystis sp. 9N]|uniref:Porin family protein n=1 Tax=Methylocystis borbori TaxID=3118750 RepID=A0ABU7XG40_9HYPH